MTKEGMFDADYSSYFIASTATAKYGMLVVF
jgi:hypothetical protein